MKRTLSEAKHELNSNLIRGMQCPCCGQHAQMYRRIITSAMAYALILFERARTSEYIHTEEYFKKLNCSSSIRGDFPKLRFWGLIERKPESKKDGNPSSGYYRITHKGRQFVYNEVKVVKAVFIYRNKVKAVDTIGGIAPAVGIRECLGNKFDYNKLVNVQSEIQFN